MKLFGSKKNKKAKAVKIIVLTLAIILALGAGAWAAFEIYTTPPEQKGTDTAAQSSDDEIDAIYTVDKAGRKDGMYTFLVAGEDDEAGGTDVIMVGMLNTNDGKLDIISIPRDTMVNVPWDVRKVNSYKNMYGYLEEDYDGYIDAMIDGVKNLIGYEVDSYITVDLDAFVTLVDAVGGVEFDVPQNMSYSDPVQGLNIDLTAGVQKLDGEKAMELIRFRHYITGDLQRISVQHDFLSALAGKLLSAQGILAIDDMVNIFQKNVDTSLTASNLLWYAKQIMNLDSASINFYTAANTEYDHGYGSYVTLNVDEWLNQINECINPYKQDITAGDLDIITQNNNGVLYLTTDVQVQETISAER